jgi:hypothetical protein
MAQHDYILANQSGAAFRSDLNNGLAAIVSNNSGVAQPSTTYAYQWWSDTTTGLLKLRNAANNAWITIGTLADANLGLLSLAGGTMTGALLADDSGTAALPAISFDGDSDTGIFRAGANELAVATNGTQRITIDSSGRLLVGTSTNIGSQNIQIGTATGTLGLYKFANNDDGGELTLANSRNGTVGSQTIVNNNDFLGRIFFRGSDGSAFLRGADIVCQVDGTPGANDMPGRLVFSTTADGAGSPTERMIINSSGTVLPATDNAYYLGVGSNRWIAVYAVNGTIQTSDKREKTEIQASALGIDFIKSLKPVSYKWNIGQNIVSKSDDGKTDVITPREGVRRHWGFIAQDVEESVNKAGVDFGGWLLEDKDDPDSRQALRYDQFIAPLTKALQEAIAKIETLEGMVAVNNITIDEQQHQLSTLAARLTALESA